MREVRQSEGWGNSRSEATEGAVQEDADAWERWLYLFAQSRQLGVLAPHLPTRQPTLRPPAYQMVLQRFLLAPADHPRLLDLVKRWPPDLLSIPSLTEAVVQRCALGMEKNVEQIVFALGVWKNFMKTFVENNLFALNVGKSVGNTVAPRMRRE